jgi:hypothetical protein
MALRELVYQNRVLTRLDDYLTELAAQKKKADKIAAANVGETDPDLVSPVPNFDFLDLLLYHRALKSLIAVELKIGEFQSEHKGKMEFYLVALNEKMKLEGENDAIGIIVCKSKKRTVVEYALKSTTLPMGIATYGLRLPACPMRIATCCPAKTRSWRGWQAGDKKNEHR